MQEMEPHGRPRGTFVRLLAVQHGGHVRVASRRNDRREVRRHVELQLRELRLVRWQIRAQPLAMRTLARALRRLPALFLAMITMIVLAANRFRRLLGRRLVAA
jgi:hypothetical protein